MFGYIKPMSSELKVRENEYYKAVYCGLCRAMGKRTGCASRLTLSYDFVFLALIRMALSGDERAVKSKRCVVHPIKKRPYIAMNDSMAYCAEACAILTYNKVKDDINDNSGIKKLSAQTLLPAASAMKRRARNLAKLDETVSECLRALSEIEAARSPSIDDAANTFGNLLGEVCAFGISDEKKRRIAREIGYHTGKFIYVTDAADDCRDDVKSNSYNPIALSYNLTDGVSYADAADQISLASRFELTQLEKAADLIDFSECNELKGIIRNIIYLGMPAAIDKALDHLKGNNEKTNDKQL